MTNNVNFILSLKIIIIRKTVYLFNNCNVRYYTRLLEVYNKEGHFRT